MSTKTKRKRTAVTASEPSAEQPASKLASKLASGAAEVPAASAVDAAAAATITLAANITVKDAGALKDVLLARLDAAGDIVIDTKNVERIDTAVMQLLCAFVRDRAARGLAISWSTDMPPAFCEAARLLGVGTLLALPAATPERAT